MHLRAVSLLLVPLVLTGCAVGPDHVRPTVVEPMPAQWAQPAATRQGLPTLSAALPADEAGGNWRWWEAFGDTTLNGLVDDALVTNNDLLAAAGRVLEARAAYGGARSTLWPTIEIGGSAVRTKSSGQAVVPAGSPLASAFSNTSNLYDANATLRYELDLWGRLRNGKDAALATLLASEQDRRTVAQGLIADVTRTWLVIRELQLQVALTERTVANFQSSLTTVNERYDRGLISSLDVYLASQNLAAAQAAGPIFGQQLAEARRRMEILVGRYPAGTLQASDLDAPSGYLTAEIMPEPLDPIPAGLPSELLDRRPDLQAAELRLSAAVARIGEAKAALYPRLSLTASAGTKSRELSDLFTAPTNVWSLAGNLFMPLINRGATKAQIKAAEARSQQAAAAYRKAVLLAFGEVENALDQDINQASQETFLADSAEQARRAVERAEDRYRRGLDNLLLTLESQRRLFNAESQLLSTQRTRRAARINLIQALGGDWHTVPAELTTAKLNDTPREGAQP
jgi:multidrug efflux system outer membrane protein